MVKKNDSLDISEVFAKLKETIAIQTNTNVEPYVPDILDFCYNKRYLNLKGQGITLFPMQEAVLKVFYRGQRGNEHLKLTSNQINMLRNEKQNDALDKYNTDKLFRELVLVFGRRAGKDFMVSLIALYESMKLLEIPGGCPYRYYELAPGNPIYILTVATSADQAKILFTEIKTKMQRSRYFSDKIGHIEAERIWLLTPEDKKQNRKLVDSGSMGALTKGSVCIMSGHSNSDSLLGKGYYCLLFDEVASFKTTGSATSGDRLYEALGPGTVGFKKPLLDKHGNPMFDDEGHPKMRLESKIISISSPRGEEGIFFKMYNDSVNVPSRVTFRLPTWKVNLSITKDLLRNENKYMSQNAFDMEFGAEFSGSGGEKFIADRYVDEAMEMGRELGLGQKIQGQPGVVYYAHLDPAATSHNYALVVLHVEERIREREKENGSRSKERVKFFVVDHLKLWEPTPGAAINVHAVDEYVIDLATRFRFAMVTYDTWNSLASVQKLRSKGVPTKVTPFQKKYKMNIYNHLEHLLVNNQLVLPYKGQYCHHLEKELKCLKRIYSNIGFKIQPDPEGIITTDDGCDALAGACGSAMENVFSGYPRSGIVSMPQGGSSPNDRDWHIGSGTYGAQQWRFLNQKTNR